MAGRTPMLVRNDRSSVPVKSRSCLTWRKPADCSFERESSSYSRVLISHSEVRKPKSSGVSSARVMAVNNSRVIARGGGGSADWG